MIFTPTIGSLGNLGTVLNKNKTTIMTVTSVIFTVKAVYDTYRLTNKLIDKRRELKEKGAGFGETALEMGKVGAPIIADVAVAVGCSVAAQVTNVRALNVANCSLIAAEQVIDSQTKAIEQKYGIEEAIDIQHKAAEIRAAEEHEKLIPKPTRKTGLAETEIRWFCPYTNQFFWATESQMDRWTVALQKKGIANMGVDLNEWLYMLPLDPKYRTTSLTKNFYFPEEVCQTGIDIYPGLTDADDEGVPYRIAQLNPPPKLQKSGW